MSEDEREIYLEIKRERKIKQENCNEEENESSSNSDDSIDIVKPDTIKQRKIIEKTAKFITESTNPQIEIVIQAKQSSNPLFNFLNKNDILYPYYQRICLLMKMGIFTYSEEISNEDNEEEINTNKKNNVVKNDDTKYINENKEDKNNSNIEKEEEEEEKYKEIEKTIPENIKLIIEKMADYIARNGSEFETLVRQKNIGDERFSFMQPWNKFHDYYKYKINKCLLNKDKNKIIQNLEKNNKNNDDKNNKNKNDDSSGNGDDNNINLNYSQIQNKINNDLIQIKKNNNENKKSESNEDESKEMKELKAKRLLKMKEILARKKMKKD